MSEPNVLGTIVLTVTDQGTYADTEYSFEEMLHQLDRAKLQFLLETFRPGPEPTD